MAFGGVHPFMLKKAAAGGGDLFLVAPCIVGSAVLCEDTGANDPSVDDVVQYGDFSGTYCGTVTATGQSGSAVHDISASGFGDCAECADEL